MEAVATSKLPRRWSKRSLVLVVLGLVLGVLTLVVAVVGFARSVGFVMHAANAAGDVGQIAPERTTAADKSVTLPIGAPTSVVQTNATPSALMMPTVAAPPGGSHAALEADTQAVSLGGVGGGGRDGGSGGALGGAAGTAVSAGAPGSGGTAGSAGASPAFWESIVQNALALVGQTTISMCGRNTCNLGQVCCNQSCGICVAQGATCDQTQCTGGPRPPTNIRCGSGQCNDGQVCCNPSCGICAAPGEACSEEQCH